MKFTQLIQDLTPLTDTEEIKEVCDRFVQMIRETTISKKTGEFSENTALAHLRDARNEVAAHIDLTPENSEEIGEYDSTIAKKYRGQTVHKAIRFIKFENSLYIRKRAENEAKNDERMDDKVVIEDVDQWLEKIPVLLASGNYLEKALGLLLATGRRTAEIFSTAQFFPLVDDEMGAIFTGRVKQKAADSSVDDVTHFPIPLLAPYKDVMQALDELRGERHDLEGIDPTEVNARVCRPLNYQCRKHFTDMIGDPEKTHAHSLRGIYAAICAHIYLEDKVDEGNYYTRILCEGGYDPESGRMKWNKQAADHYKKFIVARPR